MYIDLGSRGYFGVNVAYVNKISTFFCDNAKTDKSVIMELVAHVYHEYVITFPDSKVHGAMMGPIWGRQDPGGPHIGLTNFAIWFYVLSADSVIEWHWMSLMTPSGLKIYIRHQ